MKWNLIKDSAPLKDTWILVSDGKRIGIHYNEDGFPQNTKDLYHTTHGKAGIDVHKAEITHWSYIGFTPLPGQQEEKIEAKTDADYRSTVLTILLIGNIIASIFTIAMLISSLAYGYA